MRLEHSVMRSKNTQEIVINGVRFYVAIRLDSRWSYGADWWNRVEYRGHPLDGVVRTDPDAQRVAMNEILRAHLRKEPWLYAEVAAGEQGEAEPEPKE